MNTARSDSLSPNVTLKICELLVQILDIQLMFIIEANINHG